MKEYTYLLIDLACISIPLAFSFYNKHPFFKEWKYFFPANLIVATFFIIWDMWFTELGVWGFNPDYLSGIYISNLPIEELLFFICIPYACVFTYFAFEYLLPKSLFNCTSKWPTIISCLLCIVVAIIYPNKIYTFTTSFLLAITLLIILWEKVNINSIIITYIAILPFFFISNGILTGFSLNEPIVWYNDAENLGIRMGTIPVEDTFYGFLLILWNILLYQWMKKRMLTN